MVICCTRQTLTMVITLRRVKTPHNNNSPPSWSSFTYLPYLLPICLPHLPTYRYAYVLTYVPAACLPTYLPTLLLSSYAFAILIKMT